MGGPIKSERKASPSKSELRPARKQPWLGLRRAIWTLVGIAAVTAFAGSVAFYVVADLSSKQLAGGNSVAEPPAGYVGSEACAGCHRPEVELWHTSQHKHAMDHATEKSVIGNFSDVSFEYYGVRTRFFRKGGKFLIETDGPNGKLATFEVRYTLGVDPLQQYLVEFPDGRLQALSLAWDSRPKDKGGQRWFHLYPDEEIKHDDILHWTKLNQNWNFMCAECHSTGVRKNYDAKTDRFATTWAEISVGCETCHGQGSRHVGWAQAQKGWWPFGKIEDHSKGLPVRFDERTNVVWPIDPKTGNATRSYSPATLRKEVETCGLCHARRSKFYEDWVPGQPLSNTHFVSPLAHGLYQPDGQMLDEVYNYGSFKQSKMFAAGVTCSDCHEPHGAKLRAPGNGVCLQCHDSGKYAAATHSRHAAASPAVSCSSCHMPSRTYMVVDPRHDHSFRVPRPDLSVKLGTPNACNDCHRDKSPEWAASTVEGWYGGARKSFQKYAEAFHASWARLPDAAALLGAVASDGNAPAIARASALSELESRLSPSNVNLARAGLAHSDPMMRIGALDMLEGLSGVELLPLVSPLLSDSSRGVRIRAASLLARIPSAQLPASSQDSFGRAAAEFVAAQQLNADRPEGRSSLGRFYTQQGQSDLAEAEYKAALRLSSKYAPAAINLADLYRQLGRENEGESVLQNALKSMQQDAGLHQALGLTLIRLRRLDEALGHLQAAAELEPDRPRYPYVYAVALHSTGRLADAIAVLKGSLVRNPGDRDTSTALINFVRESGDVAAALEYAEQISRVMPNDQGLKGLIQELRRQVEKPIAR
jgi:predicted CXXCH cytochrome family protein